WGKQFSSIAKNLLVCFALFCPAIPGNSTSGQFSSEVQSVEQKLSCCNTQYKVFFWKHLFFPKHAGNGRSIIFGSEQDKVNVICTFSIAGLYPITHSLIGGLVS